MRRTAVAAVLVLAFAGVADAAPKRYCELLKRVQPSFWDTTAPGAYDDVTLRSADLATNATHLTAVIRVKALAQPSAVQGTSFGFSFSASPEHHYWIDVRVGPGAGAAVYRTSDGSTSPEEEDEQPPGPFVSTGWQRWIGTPAVTLDHASDEARFTLPLSMLGKGVVRPGTRITSLGAAVERMYGTPVSAGSSNLTGNDVLTGGRRIGYPAGAPSCVRVGR